MLWKKYSRLKGIRSVCKKWVAILHKAFGTGLTNQGVHMQILGKREKQTKGKPSAKYLRWDMSCVSEEQQGGHYDRSCISKLERNEVREVIRVK